jgi:calmodulin
MGISQEDIDNCREAFLAFDKDRSGTIDVWELRQVLEAMGQAPTEDELFTMISEVDENMSGSIDFGEVSLHYLFNVFHFISTLLLIHYI